MEQVPVSSLYQIKEEGQKGKLIRTWKDKKFNLTAKLVCTKCNNEWMSDLENEQAKPVMQCMISQGKRISLSRETLLRSRPLPLRPPLFSIICKESEIRFLARPFEKNSPVALKSLGVPKCGFPVFVADLGKTESFLAFITNLRKE